MDTIVLHRRAVAAVAPVLTRVRPVDLGLPTPCTGWDLCALLEHMTGQDHGFSAAVRAGNETDVDIDAFAPRSLGDDPAAAATASSAAAGAAFAEAATDPARTVWLAEFRNRLPLEQVAGFHLIDTLVHGWDAAVTLGLAVDYDDDLVAAGLTVAEQVPTGAFREQPESPFGPALAMTGSDPWERTLTLLGRDPHWTPTRPTATPTR
ncbi:TIGR03086 family metal-binding protein [Pseudonocardia alaniniphila]|uniref:TIGR03086 family metal-binding protein n=1 Tax=Pseudonocardia alaniniphila TaxID=75291 RepID=A0ABS9TIU1_9PSEU|nr:TIGR03086 family metal-binding protein [Pseudonocardia alaniniphila]MCH6168338.1 TIGR03086 family metal-binding protein [Pseudonocardia alaniniphila]